MNGTSLPQRGAASPLRVLLSSLIICLALTGCAAMDHDTAELTRGRLMTESEALARWGVERDWWKGYADATLNALEEEALANNTDLAKSAISVNKALYQARRIGSDMVPSFTAGADAGRSKNLDSGDSDAPSYGADLGISYELDLWRRLRDETSAAEWTLRATEQDLESARLTLTAAFLSAGIAAFRWFFLRFSLYKDIFFRLISRFPIIICNAEHQLIRFSRHITFHSQFPIACSPEGRRLLPCLKGAKLLFVIQFIQFEWPRIRILYNWGDPYILSIHVSAVEHIDLKARFLPCFEHRGFLPIPHTNADAGQLFIILSPL